MLDVKLVDIEEIQGTYSGKKMDFDRYNIEKRSPYSTKEYSVHVDFLNEKISGDCIAYGEWFDIEIEECIELLDTMLKDNKPKRDFTYILEKERSRLR